MMLSRSRGLAFAGFGAAAVASLTAAFTASPASCSKPLSTIPLASTSHPRSSASAAAAPPRPTLVLIHGLDSTRFTWAPFLAASKARQQQEWDILALDQRGHGESAMGAEEEYSIDAVVADVRASIRAKIGEEGGPVVLCGHSMGGKVAIAFAAAHPDEVKALVVEDMDLRTERAASWASAIASVEGEMDRRRHFSANRSFPTWEAAKAALGTFRAGTLEGAGGAGGAPAAYGDARIDGWKVDGRVFERESGEGGRGDSDTSTDKSTSKKAWWSGINPLAQYLALRHVLGAVGPSTWQAIARSAFPTYVFVAGRGSACDAASVDEMKALVPRTQVVAFPACGHSIHNDDVGAFMGAIDAVYLDLEVEKKTGGGRETGEDSACEATGEAAVAKL